MSFEYTSEKDNSVKKLTEEQETSIVSSLSKKFQDWDSIRQHQIDTYAKLKPEIYLEDQVKKNTWKSQKRLFKIYSLFQTRQAFLWENIFADVSKMFDVSGKTPESDATAKQQKVALSDAFDKMKVSQQLDKAIEHLDAIGEFCLFTGWKKKHRQVRRKLNFMEMVTQGKVINLLKGETQTGIFEELIYDGAYIEAINPINLVFDPSITPEIEEEWNRGGKILKSFKTYNEIATNKVYQLSKVQLFEVKEMSQGKSADDEKRDDKDKIDEVMDGDKIEVLEYWGDYDFDGQYLKNYLIVIIGRKYMARFIENPFIINPIINVAPTRHPETKRGLPCLYSVLDIAKSQEEDINETKDVKKLNKNPTRLAPKGFFKENKTEIEPGLIIEYDPNMETPSAIIPITVQLLNPEAEIQYADKVISDVSGIFPNMQGQEEKGDKTATELKIKVSGQTTRLSKDIDTLKQNGIVQMVQNVADLMANEKNGKTESLFVKENGQNIPVSIDDTVRQGMYEYKYSDSSALAVKKSQFSEALELFKMAAQVPELQGQINWKGIVEEGLGTIGIENTDKLFISAQQPQGMPLPMQMTPTQQTENIDGQATNGLGI